MKSFFKTIFDYHHHYNQLLAEQILQNLEKIPDESKKLFSHVLNAHQIWNARILGEPVFQVWQENETAHYRELDQKNYINTLNILEQKELDLVVDYKNSKGIAFSNSVQDILFHVNNHSTYHRGQLASRIKAAGITPLVTDYIYYKMDIKKS